MIALTLINLTYFKYSLYDIGQSEDVMLIEMIYLSL